MNDDQLKKFRFIRQITEDMARYNLEIFKLLEDNPSYLKDCPYLEQLHDHLQLWLAKYRAQKDNPDMCLVFVVHDEGKGFPREVENFVRSKIKELRS